MCLLLSAAVLNVSLSVRPQPTSRNPIMRHLTIQSSGTATMPNWRDIGLREEPVLGAHLISPRCGYNHHGIYVGNSKVVHYAGLAGSFHFGAVEEANIACFAAGQTVWTEPNPCPSYTGVETVARARSRLGENRYNLLTNNCEHFCAWCLYGQSRSKQVHDCLTHPRSVVHVAVGFLRAVFRATPKHGSISVAAA